jgi:sec-independent protein translocase protein TatB
MFDFAWSEIAVIAAVALIVIGPKDLPRVLRTVGQWVGKARVVAREFQSSVDQMIREAELEDIRNTVNQIATTDVAGTIEKAVDPQGEIKQALTPPALTDGTTPSAGEAVTTAPALNAPPPEPVSLEPVAGEPVALADMSDAAPAKPVPLPEKSSTAA